MSRKPSAVISDKKNSIAQDDLHTEFLRAGSLRQQGHLDSAAEAFDRLIAIAHATGDRTIEGRATNGRGIVEERREQYQLAKNYYDRALEIATEINDSIGAGLARTD